MRKIIASLDMGSDLIKIVVGEIYKSKFHVLGVVESPSKGIKKGLIENEENVLISLKKAFKKIDDVMGIKVSKIILSVPENSCRFDMTEGISTITSEDNVITGNDIVRAMQASVYNKVMDTMELVNIIPVEFIVDDETKVIDPKDMIAKKLGVKCVITSVLKKHVIPYINVLEKLNIQVVDITVGSVGDYYAYKDNETDKKVGVLVNLGAEKTTVAIFNKGILVNTEVIDMGGNNIDNDIAFIYKLNRSDAKYLKENFALAHKRFANPAEVETITNKLGEELKINQYEITEIVSSRLAEILNLSKKQINLLTKKEISYIIMTGGLTESKDFAVLLDEVYGKNVIIGSIKELGVRNNKYSVAVGMIKYFDNKLSLRNKNFSIYTVTELEELGSYNKKINLPSDSIIGKFFGYFFDN